MFRSGKTKTTEIGYINKNRQQNHGTRGASGTDHGQHALTVRTTIIRAKRVVKLVKQINEKAQEG